ncbi:restriction endonuclease subunit S [Psychrobacillus sp. NEAU-3TGS]|uniref:restriction endonuclease subunit S n=1 Tax=Psychrobacillus sp. NEAU-3TGS TaxID=2995412 RepID=UPI002498DA7E|nr:restriction endonuclease subunit S [Psychrobacillus sp. NEAU-3TGS]MDI2586600.1 restriction endonuclease subunit S [Psychrobacillus sp. NEAU-3TGS]
MKIKHQKMSEFSSEPTLRFDFKFIVGNVTDDKDYYTYKSLFKIIPYKKCEIDLDTTIQYAEIGNVSKLGEVFPVALSNDNRNELNEDLFKKIEKGDIISPEKGDILLSSIRPYLNKVVLIREDEFTNNKDIYFTKAFIQIRPLINSKVLYYLLRTILSSKINAVSRQGKGYPTLKESDLKNIRFSKDLLDHILDNEETILADLEKVESEIGKLNSLRINKKEIVDKIFAQEFNLDIKSIFNVESIKNLKVPISSITNVNKDLRYSFRWNKMKELQGFMYENIDCIERLGKYILSTNNGWSPESIVAGEGIPVLGQEHFDFGAYLDVHPTKATIKTRPDINKFFIKKGDFFISRGNTVGLVGLASIVHEEINENIIYPDLYIKVQFSKEILPKYIALVFNSFLGRSYFKYVSKGKNQSMVKVSSNELLNFYLPIPDMSTQEKIVKSVQEKIEVQDNLSRKAILGYGKIDKIFNDFK